MYALLHFFFDLALLRRAPQDLPASPVLLALLICASILLGTINGTAVFGGMREALGANLIDLVLSLLLVLLLLQFRGHTARWLQTATAFLGLGVLAGAILLLIRGPAELLGVMELVMLLELVLAIWLHLALGNVLRHALEIPLFPGVIIVLSYTVMVFSFIAGIFPPVSMTQ